MTPFAEKERHLREQIDRGNHVQALLEDKHLVQALEAMETALLHEWRNTPPDNGQRREDAWRSLRLLDNLKNGLAKHVLTGQTAAKELLNLSKQVKRI